MSYLTTTTAFGCRDLAADPKPADFDAILAWCRRVRVHVHRRGRWTPERMAAAARKAGAIGDIEVTVTTIDLNGLGRGGHDARWLVTAAGTVTPVPIAAEEQEAEAAMQDADVQLR